MRLAQIAQTTDQKVEKLEVQLKELEMKIKNWTDQVQDACLSILI